MKIVFFGSSHFGLPSLEALLRAGHEISCVVTQPDKHSGRGLPVSHTLIKEFAVSRKLKIYQPEKVNAPASLQFLQDLHPEIFVVIAYGQILFSPALAIPRIFSVNVHASLLPRYRGASPINRAIINGDKVTGVTVMKMVREMDAGPLIRQKQVEIDADDSFLTLEARLAEAGAEVLCESLACIAADNCKLEPQNLAKVTLAPKLKKEDGEIDWSRSATQICDLIRGCIVWPGAFTHYRGKLVKIYRARAVELCPGTKACAPGEIAALDKTGIFVACGQNSLVIEELQIESKRKMTAAEFLAGHKVSIGEVLGK